MIPEIFRFLGRFDYLKLLKIIINTNGTNYHIPKLKPCPAIFDALFLTNDSFGLIERQHHHSEESVHQHFRQTNEMYLYLTNQFNWDSNVLFQTRYIRYRDLHVVELPQPCTLRQLSEIIHTQFLFPLSGTSVDWLLEWEGKDLAFVPIFLHRYVLTIHCGHIFETIFLLNESDIQNTCIQKLNQSQSECDSYEQFQEIFFASVYDLHIHNLIPIHYKHIFDVYLEHKSMGFI